MHRPNPQRTRSFAALSQRLQHAVGRKSWRQSFAIHFAPAAKPQVTGQLKAAITEVDITPFPGVPKGGYSAMSQTAVGYRGRLRARVFYIRPARGESFCLLQADLHAGSALIRNRVAELVALHTDINPGNIMLTCTHTHSGPGQLLESDFYNRFASHKPGLDWDLFQETSQRIADAVIRAWREQRPAKIASGALEVTGLTRNRSLVPYLNNRDEQGDLLDPQLKYQAVNPWLHLVRFDLLGDDGNYHPAGAFSNFSIHGTCVPASSDVFSADTWGYVSAGLENWVRQTYQPPWKPIHGPSQGTHGDIAPDVTDKDIGVPEARRIGTAIAKHACTLFQGLDEQLQEDIRVRSGLRMVDFFMQSSVDDIKIASHPMIGTALTAGAFEHSTPLLYHLPLFKHGMGSARIFSQDSEHGRKRKVAGDLQKLFLPKQAFPHKILFQVAQLGELVLVGVPFEVSVKAGQEIAAGVGTALREAGQACSAGSSPRVCVASLTNGYTGYTTTAAEYEKQYYEGGHTLYGPQSNQFIARHCQRLMADTLVEDHLCDIPEVWEYSLQCREYQGRSRAGVIPLSEPRWQGRPVLVDDPREPCVAAEFSWQTPRQLPWHDRMISVETRDVRGNWQPLRSADGVAVDDLGTDIEVRYQGERFRVLGYLGRLRGEFRFVLWYGQRPVSVSEAFALL